MSRTRRRRLHSARQKSAVKILLAACHHIQLTRATRSETLQVLTVPQRRRMMVVTFHLGLTNFTRKVKGAAIGGGSLEMENQGSKSCFVFRFLYMYLMCC